MEKCQDCDSTMEYKRAYAGQINEHKFFEKVLYCPNCDVSDLQSEYEERLGY